MANRHAGFPWPVILVLTDALLRGVVIPGRAAAVIDDEVGLKRASEINHALAAGLVELLRDVKPDQPERSVLGDEFLDLRAQILFVTVEVRDLAFDGASRTG